MSKSNYLNLGSIMAIALMADSFNNTFPFDDSNKGTNKLNPKDIDTTPKQRRLYTSYHKAFPKSLAISPLF
jgi:hypothetical protein